MFEELIARRNEWWKPEEHYHIDTDWIKKTNQEDRLTIIKETYRTLFYHFELILIKMENHFSLDSNAQFLLSIHCSKSSIPLTISSHSLLHHTPLKYVDVAYGINKFIDFTTFLEDEFIQSAYPNQLLLPIQSEEMAISFYNFWKEKLIREHEQELEDEEYFIRHINSWK